MKYPFLLLKPYDYTYDVVSYLTPLPGLLQYLTYVIIPYGCYNTLQLLYEYLTLVRITPSTVTIQI